MSNQEPFHAGEIAVQERTGDREMAARLGTVLRDVTTPVARAFLALQTSVAIGTLDGEGRLWATWWLGPAGFVHAEERAVHVAHGVELYAGAGRDDPSSLALARGRPIGLLAIDLATRRRLRINGVVGSVQMDGFDVVIREVFPNCPKYIQRRTPTARESPGEARTVGRGGDALDAEMLALVARADTSFVTSVHPERGVDVSHRGGAPGFVRATSDRTLRVPDYPGNGMYQTLGNFEVDRRAGMTFVDFDRGRLLALTGTVSVTYGEEDPTHPTGGTGRYWDFAIERWLVTPLGGPASWSLLDRSPFNPTPGDASAAGDGAR